MLPAAIGLAATLGAACAGEKAPATAEAPYTGVIDSALPIDTLLRRFRATMADTPATLTGGEASAESLTRAFLQAVSANDTTTVRRLLLSRAEFAWLYYPHTRFTRPPYELGPELLWIQIGEASEKGIVRMLRRYGGTSLRFEALECPDTAAIEGPNRITAGCAVRFAAGDSAARTLRIFGSIIARDGRYKFVGYTNDL